MVLHRHVCIVFLLNPPIAILELANCLNRERLTFLKRCYWLVGQELAFLTADIFGSFGVLPLLHPRAYTLQDATVYTCSYLYSGNFIISTVKSRYSHCFNCLKLFNEDRQYPKNGRFWP